VAARHLSAEVWGIEVAYPIVKDAAKGRQSGTASEVAGYALPRCAGRSVAAFGKKNDTSGYLLCLPTHWTHAGRRGSNGVDPLSRLREASKPGCRRLSAMWPTNQARLSREGRYRANSQCRSLIILLVFLALGLVAMCARGRLILGHHHVVPRDQRPEPTRFRPRFRVFRSLRADACGATVPAAQ